MDHTAGPHAAAGQPGEVVIRRATTADLPALGRLGALLVRQHHDYDPRRFLAASGETADRYAAFLGSLLRNPDALVLVAESGGSPVGYACAVVEGCDWMSLRGPAAVVHDLVVDPGHRGRGTGRLLIDTMLSRLASRGAPRVVLSTAARNERAQRLFEREGFRKTMIEMTLDLADPDAATGSGRP
jgi:ribosomal protein S18 acetylase RimI-like enzyme